MSVQLKLYLEMLHKCGEDLGSVKLVGECLQLQVYFYVFFTWYFQASYFFQSL